MITGGGWFGRKLINLRWREREMTSRARKDDVMVFFFINVGVYVSLCVPRLILQTLKLTTI
jgi:hypothetical protein